MERNQRIQQDDGIKDLFEYFDISATLFINQEMWDSLGWGELTL